MKRFVLLAFLWFAASLDAATNNFQLPAFPLPALVSDGGSPAEISSMRLLRELHRAGLSGFDHFDTADSDYVLFRSDSLGVLAAWLETVCTAVNFDIRTARTRAYDGTVFARLLDVATSLAELHTDHRALAMPVGILICQRAAAWGELPADGASDVYVVFATEDGILVYDPPTRQLVSLADFPNKAKIVQIRF